MTIQVISNVSLKTISVEVQDSADFIFRQLGDPSVSTRNGRGGQREIVNTLYYQLTPLRSGNLLLDPIKVTGQLSAGTMGESRYSVVEKHRRHLNVLPPDPSVQPWLPLHDLELSVNLSNDEDVGEGRPLTLQIEQRAVGMSGSQLLSPEKQLQAKGHRVYREKTEHSGTISKEGLLVGTRLDRFTLVPQQGNRVAIPSVHFDWWNVDRERKETAVLPGRLLNDRGQHPLDETSDSGAGGISLGVWLIWIAMLSVAFLLGLFWPALLPYVKAATNHVEKQVRITSHPLRLRIGGWLNRLSPRRNMHRLRRAIANSLPRSARLWFCVRSADSEPDPSDWAQVLRFLVNRRLDLPMHLPMNRLADRIIEIHPGANPDEVRRLLLRLETALFAGQELEDFDAWKKAFKRQIRPHLFYRRRRLQAARMRAASGLPRLNPV